MRSLLVATAVVVPLLGGCGVEGLQWHPGVAATVGDQTITDQRVDDLAQDYCGAVRSEITQSSQVLPLRYLRSAVVREMIGRAAAEQLAGEYDVRPGEDYNQAVAQVQASTANLPSGAADAVVTLGSLRPYVDSVTQQVGGVLLDKQGEKDATPDQETAAGAKALARWIEDHTVDVDPRYDIAIENGAPKAADTDLSFPVGAAATAGLKTSPDQDYAAGLSANQVCG